MAGKGWTVPEAERAFTSALELGQRTSANRELLAALHGLSAFFKMAASYDKARTQWPASRSRSLNQWAT